MNGACGSPDHVFIFISVETDSAYREKHGLFQGRESVSCSRPNNLADVILFSTEVVVVAPTMRPLTNYTPQTMTVK